jgi:hypothetical protein
MELTVGFANKRATEQSSQSGGVVVEVGRWGVLACSIVRSINRLCLHRGYNNKSLSNAKPLSVSHLDES